MFEHTPKYLLAMGLVLIIAIAMGFVFFIPAKTEKCLDSDGICPRECTTENDNDCANAGVAPASEVRRCINSEDCIIVDAICGNPECTFSDYKCEYMCSCGTAINKNYLSAWKSANTKCIGSVKICKVCPPKESMKPVCIRGECGVQM